MRTRTTLSIDDDVLAYAREIADVTGRPLGEVISELARRSIADRIDVHTRNGIELLPAGEGAGRATLDDVNALRDQTS